MEISDIKIRKTMHEGRLRALVSITIDNAIAVHEIKIVWGTNACSWQCRATVNPPEITVI